MRKPKKKGVIKFLERHAVNQEQVQVTVTPLSLSTIVSGGKSIGKNLIYVKLNNHKVKKTVEVDKGRIFVDYDRRGNVVGVEII